jgi:deoxyribonuclease V
VLACVDVYYRERWVTAALVGFDSWTDARPAREIVKVSDLPPHDYQSGELYKRELPYLLEVLRDVEVELVIVDGYVWLGPGRRGLGAHLHHEIRVPVIGVAKSEFAGADAIQVQRGRARPLYVTAEGIDAHEAAERIRAMHGDFRVPTLLRRVDQLTRNT